MLTTIVMPLQWWLKVVYRYSSNLYAKMSSSNSSDILNCKSKFPRSTYSSIYQKNSTTTPSH